MFWILLGIRSYIMKRIQQIGMAITACIAVTYIFAHIIYNDYTLKRDDVVSSASSIFKEAIVKENSTKMKGVPVYIKYEPHKSSDNVPVEEKLNFIIQDYITSHDSSRLYLDSLFHKLLIENKLQCSSAISYKLGNKIQYSCRDTAFYRNATVLKPVVYRFDPTHEKQIVLQGYVQLSPFTILKQGHFLYIMICLWLSSIAVVIGLYLFLQKWRQKREQAQKRQKGLELERQEKEMLNKHIPFKDKKETRWIDLSDEISFCKENGVLKDGDKIVTLRNNSLKLFSLLLDNLNHTVTYKTIAVNVMKHVVTDDVSIYDKNSIFTLVSCLKKSLHVLPNIKIKAVINTGYIMTIEESHFSDSVSSTSNN